MSRIGVESSMSNGRFRVSSATFSHSSFLPLRRCLATVRKRKQGLPVIGADIVCGPVAWPLTSTSPRAALRIFEVGVLSNVRLRASRRNPWKKKYKPPTIAINERMARWLIGGRTNRQALTVLSSIFSEKCDRTICHENKERFHKRHGESAGSGLRR